MGIKILVATHKEYEMPNSNIYLPIQVGAQGKESLGYTRDDTGENISKKNANYCELTGLYWGYKNLESDYWGLVHYRRHFKSLKSNSKNKFSNIISENELLEILEGYDVILPKKQKYYIETLYSHYAHTHNEQDLRVTRDIIQRKYPEYIRSFDKIMKRKSAHMFNMFIMKKEFADKYCEWLFSILFELEKNIDIEEYDKFHARLFGRISEMLLDVWLDYNGLSYYEVPVLFIGKIQWVRKIRAFLQAKFLGKKYESSF